MSVRLYMDVHVPRAVTTALRLRRIDVLTAQEDGADHADDEALLRRATSLERVLITQDEDLLREGAHFLRDGIDFAGIVYAHFAKHHCNCKLHQMTPLPVLAP